MSGSGGSRPDARGVAAHEFSKARKGYDPTEVRKYLSEIAEKLEAALDRETRLQSELDDLRAAKSAPVAFDEAVATRALGDETVRIIEAARDAAGEIRTKAEEHAERVVRDAHERANRLTADALEVRDGAKVEAEALVTAAEAEAASIRSNAEAEVVEIRASAEAEAEDLIQRSTTVLAEKTESAESAAKHIVDAAQAEADATTQAATQVRSEAEEFVVATRAAALADAEGVASGAATKAEELIEASRETGREMIREAKEARERILRDLAERRFAARQQLEALRAAQERILEAFTGAQDALSDATGQVIEGVPSARVAAADAAAAVVADIDAEVIELDELVPSGPEVDFGDSDTSSDSDGSTDAEIHADTVVDELEDNDEDDELEDDNDEDDNEGDDGNDDEGDEDEESSPTTDDLGPAHLRLVASNGEPEVGPSSGSTAASVIGIGNRSELTGDESAERSSSVSEDEYDDDEYYDDYDDDDDYDEDDDDDDDEVLRRDASRSLTVVTSLTSVHGEESDGSDESVESVGEVDELFAKLRGTSGVSKDADVADHRATTTTAVTEIPRSVEDEIEATMRGGVVIDLSAGEAVSASTDEDSEIVEHQSLLDARDDVLAGLTGALMRSVRRVVSDQENEVLDVVRRHPKWKSSDKLLPSASDMADTLNEAIHAHVNEILLAGGDFVGPVDGRVVVAQPSEDDFDAVCGRVSEWLVQPIHARMARLVDESDDASPDRFELVDRLRNAYRELRNDRLSDLVGDVATFAFNRGIMSAMGAGGRVCWMVDNGGLPCPDAEDNQLNGPTVVGDEFPTGDLLPPAHPGCRCLLTPQV